MRTPQTLVHWCGSRRVPPLAYVILAAGSVACHDVKPDILAPPANGPAWRAAHETRAAGIRAFAATVKLTVRQGTRGGAAEAAVWVLAGAAMRTEVKSFFGQPSLIVAGRDGRYALLDIRAGVFVPGVGTGRLPGVGLSLPELAGVLIGAPPLPSDGQWEDRGASPEGWPRVLVRGAGTQAQLEFDPETASLRRARFRGPGQTWRVTYGPAAPINGVAVAATIDWEPPGNDVHVTAKLHDIEVNGAISPSIAGLAPPEGMPVWDYETWIRATGGIVDTAP